MWKLMIADDEPRIRNGLRKALPWEDKGIEVAAEAENGLEALEIAKIIRPDILFVDINMPLMNGLELIERLQEELPECIIIVITGHDEFLYAQKAVRLSVFDYLLKPVQKSELSAVTDKALQVLSKERIEQKYVHWMNHKLEGSSNYLREEFMRKWLTGKLSDEQIGEELQFFQLLFRETIGLLVVKPLSKISLGSSNKNWDPVLLEFAVKNVMGELLQHFQPSVVFSVGKGMIAAVVQAADIARWMTFHTELELIVKSHFGVGVMICHVLLDDSWEIQDAYLNLLSELNHASALTPIILTAKKYLETYYYKEDLSLSEVAEQLKVDPNYLSKLLKKELGKSFIDCLTDIRIKKAIQYLNDPNPKIYEIAEKVGYNSQHYFSHTFKKITGFSPLEYRKRGDSYES
ncbi:MAG: two component transcriptional regulator, AraC family [Bacilli bacterium]|nr:two component transcriptional regulator, AraC family [Bacilli bacterium]